MILTKLAPAALVSTSLLAGLMFGDDDNRYRDLYQLSQIQTNFHGAGTKGDADLMASIWTEDAVFKGGGNVVKGRDNIVDFFKKGADWGKAANTSPTYKSTFDIRGNKATIRFECVITRVTGSSPLTTALSTLPPGKQNPKVEIVQHSNTTIEAVRVGGNWKIHTFTGAGGAIQ